LASAKDLRESDASFGLRVEHHSGTHVLTETGSSGKRALPDRMPRPDVEGLSSTSGILFDGSL